MSGNTNNKSNIFTEYVFEFRYNKLPIFEDFKGTIAQKLIDLSSINFWNIAPERVDGFDSDSQTSYSERVFISNRNAGYVLRKTYNQREFIRRVENFLLIFYSLDQLFPEKNVRLSRIGVKCNYGIPTKKDFSDLFDLYKAKYVQPSDSIEKIFNSNLRDIGGFLDFEKDGIYIHSMSGPMEGNQIKQYFPFYDTEISTVFFFGIDSFKTPNDEFGETGLQRIFEQLLRNNGDTFKRLCNEMGLDYE